MWRSTQHAAHGLTFTLHIFSIEHHDLHSAVVVASAASQRLLKARLYRRTVSTTTVKLRVRLSATAETVGHEPGRRELAMSTTTPQQATTGQAAAIERGHEARRTWVSTGVLVSAKDFAERCGLTEQAVVDKTANGDLFSVLVDNDAWWPAQLLRMAHHDAVALCRALSAGDDGSKLVFLMRRHGSLGGLTAADAVAQGKLHEVLSLAQAWHQ